MDSLTHGLLGLAVAALRRTDSPSGMPLSPTDRATLVACVIAAELPDLDYLWPAADPVLHALRAHRGLSHALLAAPLVALVATLVAKVVNWRARTMAPYPFALAAVLFAHLLADAWTGWGTRLLLPFSAERVTLDWMMVLDPLFTLPLALAAVLAWKRRERWQRRLLMGLVISLTYLALRIGVQQGLRARLAPAYPSASVHVFPSVLGLTSYRYVAVFDDEYAAGEVAVFSSPRELKRLPRALGERSRELARKLPTVREVLAWARFPIVTERERPAGATLIEVADLRYHLHGEPTLKFMLEVNAGGELAQARLERGGSLRALFERWRAP